MTIGLVTDDRRAAWGPWNMSPAQRHLLRDGGLDSASLPFADPEGADPGPNWTDPTLFRPENDVALARMLGCAMLVGIAGIVGLLMLLF